MSLVGEHALNVHCTCSPALSPGQAMKYIFNMKCRLAEMKDKEDTIRRGLNIFKIEQPPSNSIQQMEKVRPCKSANERVYVKVCTVRTSSNYSTVL